MPTKLNSNITRETQILIDGKSLLITITTDNQILLKQKGTKKVKSINIIDIWETDEKKVLFKEDKPKNEPNRIIKDNPKEPMVNLNWLRSQSAITDMGLEYTVKFDMILKTLIDESLKEKGVKES